MAERKKVDKEIRKPDLEVKTNLVCIGSICFQSDGSIIVKVPKDANPECAERTAKSILGNKPVKFEIEVGEKEEKP